MATPVPLGSVRGSFPDGSFRDAPRLHYRVEGESCRLLVVELTPDESIWFDSRVVVWKSSDLRLAPRDPAAPVRAVLDEQVHDAKVTGPGSIGLANEGSVAAIAIGEGATILVRVHSFLAASSSVKWGPVNRLGDVWTQALTAHAPGIVWVSGRRDVFDVTVPDGETFDLWPARWLYLESGTMNLTLEHLSGTPDDLAWLRVNGPARAGFQTG
jgi:uncharacterized protein (AIM24 family)